MAAVHTSSLAIRMLGLRRHTVRLEQHDPAWAREFQKSAALIRKATGIPDERIQHVGSTAVPQLLAKPILDINIGITELKDIEGVVARLIELGYIDRGEGEGGIGRLLVWESAPEIRTIHLHLLPFDSGWWLGDLLFRDALCADSELREQYGRLKFDLAHRFPEDRRAYRQAKGVFFQDVASAFWSRD